MYQAELKGKLSRGVECKEDLLTSNVFSFLKYADRKLFLGQFLERFLHISITENEALEAEFYFWPTLENGVEPDVVIVAGDHYCLVEAKYIGSVLSVEQILKELNSGSIHARNRRMKMHLLAITDDYSIPVICADPQLTSAPLSWTSWGQFCSFLESILDEHGCRNEAMLMVTDLHDLLLRKNLRPLRPFHEVLPACKLKPLPRFVFFDYREATYRGGFVGFRDALGGVPVIRSRTGVLFFKRQREYWVSNSRLSELPSPCALWGIGGRS